MLPLPFNKSIIPTTNPSRIFLSQNVICGLLKSHSKLHVRASNFRTLYYKRQQDSLVRTLESHTFDVLCVRETGIRDLSTTTHSISSCQRKELARFTCRLSGDPTATSYGLAGVGIVFSSKAEQALLHRYPVGSALFN